MSAFLATAVFTLKVIAPFIVLAVLIALIGCGGVVLLQGWVTKKWLRATVGALVLAAGLGSGLTLVNWGTIKPPEGSSSGVHVLVFESWQQTRARFWERGRLATEANERRSED